MKRFYGIVAMGLILGLSSSASAHIGDRIYLIFELSEADLADIDLHDADITDWEDMLGDASLVTTDFFQSSDVGGAPYDPADLDYRIWLAWNGNLGTIWMGTERIDNIYINEYAGGDLNGLWRYDSIEFMLDGDHTGGDYTLSADENWTDEERDLNNNRTAQHYLAIGDTPDGRHVGYLGRGTEWVNALPYADGGGGSTGDGPTTTITEFFVTPFDDLIWNSQEDSVPSPLFDGKIIGFDIAVPDFDTAPVEYQAFHTLSGQPATWRFAERFVDARLVSAGGDIGQVTTDSDGEEDEGESSGEDQPEPEEQPTTAVELEGISSSHDSVREDDGQATTIILTVTLDKTARTDETITLAIVSPTQGKTAKRNEDFEATLPETLIIARGQRTGTAQLTLTPKDNTTADGDKAFAVQATSSSGHAALINIKIIDNDTADEPQAWLMPNPAEVQFSADDPAWKTFIVHTNLDSVLVRANPSGSDPAIEVSGGQQAPTRDFCPAEGNDRPTSGRRDGWNLHVKACQAGQTKILLIDYDTGAVVQQYEVNVEASGSSALTALNPSYPNPFNSETTLSYTLPTASDIRLEVFTLSGQRVAVLHEGFQAAGYHTIAMDASDLASGVYLYRLTTPEGRFVQKFTLLR